MAFRANRHNDDDKGTGLHITNHKLPNEYQDLLLAMLEINKKFILTGSGGLYLLDALDRKPGDIDLALTEPLTPEELNIFRDFFSLNATGEGGIYTNEDTKEITYDARFNAERELKRPLIQFHKRIKTGPGDHDYKDIKIDIFNRYYHTKRDIFFVDYKTPEGDFKIRVLHPSWAIGEKCRYAFDGRMRNSAKHWADIDKMIKDGYRLYNTMKQLRSQETIEDREEFLKFNSEPFGF